MPKDPTELLDRMSDLPLLPDVATHIMSIADDPGTGAIDLANVMAADQALTGKLIHLCNSAYYGFGRRVSSVREAVTILGFDQVREVAISMSMMNAFSRNTTANDAFDLDLFWGHSVAVAVTARSVARRTRSAKPEDAFTAGILHDIGRLVLRESMPFQFAEALAHTRATGTPLHESELQTTGYDHADVGRALSERWSFPTHLIEAVAGHHEEGLSPQVHGIAGVLAQSNRLGLHYGLCCGFDVDESFEPGELPRELSETEADAGGIGTVVERAFAFIASASGRPQNWYAGNFPESEQRRSA